MLGVGINRPSIARALPKLLFLSFEGGLCSRVGACLSSGILEVPNFRLYSGRSAVA